MRFADGVGPLCRRADEGSRNVATNAEGLSAEDLDAEHALALPEREAMSKISIGAGSGIDNFAMPINEATAMNIGSEDSIAIADADQIMIINPVDQD